MKLRSKLESFNLIYSFSTSEEFQNSIIISFDLEDLNKSGSYFVEVVGYVIRLF